MTRMIRSTVVLILCLVCTTATAADLSADVKEVVRGDTLTASVGGTTKTIRLKYIECAPPAEALGAKAKQMTEQLCLGKTVRVEVIEDLGAEGLVGDIALDRGKTLSVKLLEAGLARLKESSDVPQALRKAFLQSVTLEKGMHARVPSQAMKFEPSPPKPLTIAPADEVLPATAPPQPVIAPATPAERTPFPAASSVRRSRERTVPARQAARDESSQIDQAILIAFAIVGVITIALAAVGVLSKTRPKPSRSPFRKALRASKSKRIPKYVLVMKGGARPQNEQVFLSEVLRRYAYDWLTTPGITIRGAYNGLFADGISVMTVTTCVIGSFRAGGWQGDIDDYDLEWTAIEHTDGTKGALVSLYLKA